MARPVVTEWIGRDVSASRTAEKVAAKYTVAGKEFERAGGRIKGLTEVTDKLGVGFLDTSVAAAAAGTAAVAFYKDTVRAASDLNETESKTKAVFGAASDEVFKFGKTAATSVGQSQQQAEEAADMSIKLDQLAGDLASFNNVDPAQVLEDLRSGLLGESEPMRKYGVALNEATVQQEAMRETGKTNAKQLSESEKVTARYNLILKATTTAQGDFARTSDGLANSQRILNAEIENVKASIGTALLPVMTEGVHAATLLAEGFQAVNDASHGAATKLAILGPALGPLNVAWDKGADILHQFTGASKDAGKATGDQALQTAFASKSQQDLRLEMARAVPGVDASADATNRAADANKRLKDQLDQAKKGLAEARQEYAQQVESVQKTVESYDGLISKSKFTATQVIGDLRTQTANFVTYAADVKYLIHKGIGQDALGWLEQKGPEYVHGLAVGTDKQLAVFEQNWRARGQAIKGPFAAAMSAQYKKLKKTIEDMQDKINELSGKTIYLTAKASVEINKSVRLYLQSIPDLKAFHAQGALIPGYGGGDVYPAMLEPGEAVVRKELVKRPEFQAWAKTMGIPGFQLGGLTTRFYNPVKAGTWTVGRQMDAIAAGAIGMLAQQAGYGSGGPMPASRNEAIARQVAAAQFGWIGSQWSALRSLLMGESGFRNTAQNPTSTAYGMYQFLNSTWATVGGHKTSAPRLQSIYGDRYIRRVYGEPIGAYGAWLSRSPHWYDQGGMLPTGASIAVNRTGRPEPVGIDYDRLGRAVAKALREEPPQVWLDNRRVDRQQATAQVLNARRH